MAHCDAWKKRKGKATATLRMSASIACRRLAKRGFSSGKLSVSIFVSIACRRLAKSAYYQSRFLENGFFA